jgi:hypothetical protein
MNLPVFPKPPPRVRSVLILGDGLAVCIAGDKVRVDISGDVHNGRVSTLLGPAEAIALAAELGALCRLLGPKG